MTTARQNQTATLLPTGQVLVAGGCSYPYCINLTSAELYNPALDTWSSTGSMSTGHGYHTATLLTNGQVLVAGGFNTSAELYDPSTGVWTPTGNLNVARQNATATLLPNGQVLVAGGCCDNNLNDLASAELYDPTTGVWTLTGNLNIARQGQTATLLPNGQVLVAGGCCDGTGAALAGAELYDPSTGVWTPTGNLNVARQNATATLLPNGQVLVAGGATSAGTVSSAELYDPNAGVWSPTGGLVTARQGQTATLLPNGSVLVTGGVDTNAVALATTELYTPGDSPLVRLSQTGVVLNNIRVGAVSPTQTVLLTNTGNLTATISSVALTGTAASDVSSTTSCIAAILLPGASCAVAIGLAPTAMGVRGAFLTITTTAPSGVQTVPVFGYGTGPNAWMPIQGMTVAREYHTATLLPTGKVLIAGGCCGLADTLLASAKLYDPGTGTWTSTGSMSTPRQYHTATLLPTGKVLIAGGCGDTDCGISIASAELYDPSTGTFTPTGSMTTARRYHTATLLPNGQVLIAGGCCDSAGNVLASAELYNPTTGAFTPTGSMSVAREYHTATLFTGGPLQGKVLVAGGDCCGGPSSAELYDPSTGTFTPTGSMTAAREYHTATLLPTGKVLIAGGCCALASAELYDPSTGAFTPTGSMTVGRQNHTATLLKTGQTLVTGGCCGLSGFLSTAELYGPAALAISPTSGTVGQSVTLSGANLFAVEPIQIYVDPTSTAPLTTTTSTAGGWFVDHFFMPPLPYGAHTVIAVGQHSGAVVSVSFRVRPLLLVAPTSGPTGASIVVSGYGFGALEPITVTWDQPLQVLGATMTDASGAFVGGGGITTTIPLSSTGLRTLYAVGGNSHAVGIAHFSVH